MLRGANTCFVKDLRNYGGQRDMEHILLRLMEIIISEILKWYVNGGTKII